jgi:hypothetical protein
MPRPDAADVAADVEVEEGLGEFAALGRTVLGASITVQVGRDALKLRTKFDKFAECAGRATGV